MSFDYELWLEKSQDLCRHPLLQRQSHQLCASYGRMAWQGHKECALVLSDRKRHQNCVGTPICQPSYTWESVFLSISAVYESTKGHKNCAAQPWAAPERSPKMCRKRRASRFVMLLMGTEARTPRARSQKMCGFYEREVLLAGLRALFDDQQTILACFLVRGRHCQA